MKNANNWKFKITYLTYSGVLLDDEIIAENKEDAVYIIKTRRRDIQYIMDIEEVDTGEKG